MIRPAAVAVKLREHCSPYRPHKIIGQHVHQRRALPGAKIDQIERDIQRSGAFHDPIRVVVHGLLIQRVHFVRLGLSSGSTNLIGDFPGILQAARSKKYLCAGLGQGAGNRSAQRLAHPVKHGAFLFTRIIGFLLAQNARLRWVTFGDPTSNANLAPAADVAPDPRRAPRLVVERGAAKSTGLTLLFGNRPKNRAPRMRAV